MDLIKIDRIIIEFQLQRMLLRTPFCPYWQARLSIFGCFFSSLSSLGCFESQNKLCCFLILFHFRAFFGYFANFEEFY